MPLIEIRDISKQFKTGENRVIALDRVNLCVNSGEFISVVGASGSGKTTLMNILGCLDIPTSGDYILCGSSVKRLSDNRLSLLRNTVIGFIFQGFNLIPSLTAVENVELPLVYRGCSRAKRRELALAALSAVGLDNRKYHKPSELSGGQQQRVAIARAIAAKPPILLADEPTGNLDSASGHEILSVLKELNGEGRTIIIITHDTKIAMQTDRIVSISDGHIVSDIKSPHLRVLS